VRDPPTDHLEERRPAPDHDSPQAPPDLLDEQVGTATRAS
jgi:hypothetical protein